MPERSGKIAVLDFGRSYCKVLHSGSPNVSTIPYNVKFLSDPQSYDHMCYVSDNYQPLYGDQTSLNNISLPIILKSLITVIFKHYLHSESRDSRVLILENPFMQVSLKEAIARILFMEFSVRSISFVVTHVFAAFAASSSTSIVVESGYKDTLILEGQPLIFFMSTNNVSGSLIDRYLWRFMCQSSFLKITDNGDTSVYVDESVKCSEVRYLMEQLKQNYCTLASPMEGTATLEVQRKHCVSFDFSAFTENVTKKLLGADFNGNSIALSICETLLRLPGGMQESFASNLVFTGGCFNVPGLSKLVLAQVKSFIGSDPDFCSLRGLVPTLKEAKSKSAAVNWQMLMDEAAEYTRQDFSEGRNVPDWTHSYRGV